ncbi:MAG: hypothetical protein U0U70_15485 [Chitinophagaceae bacterium]
MKLFASILIIFFLTNCTNGKVKTTQDGLTFYDSLKKNIIGKWGGEKGGPVFEIRQDSIYYFDKDSSFLYKLNGDTFLVHLPNQDSIVVFGKLRVVGDTLQIIDFNMNNFITYGFRYRN